MSFATHICLLNRTMMFKILMVFIAVGGVVGLVHTDCYMEGVDQCDYIKEPYRFPDTFEELKQDCNVVQEALKCALNVSKGCPGSENFTHKIEKLLAYIEKNCKEDSDLYQVISQNYECILPLARNKHEECSLHRLHSDDLQKLMSMVDQFKDVAMCLEITYEITCSAHIVGLECGYEAYEAVADILKNIDIRYEECSEETLRELMPFAYEVESAITRSRITNFTTLECPEENGVFGVPGHCEFFLQCFNGKPNVEPCPYGFVFDSTKHCTLVTDDNPDCGFPTPEQKELNSYCPADYGYFPHPHDCRKYVVCHEGRGTLKSCPENQVYRQYNGCVTSDTCL